LLLNHNAEVNVKDNRGMTALMYASLGGHSAVIELLISDVDSQDDDGNSALMKSCDQSEVHYKTIKLLLEKKATVNLRSKKGWSALMFVVNQGNLEVAKMLRQFGAEVDVQSDEAESPLKVAKTHNFSSIIEFLEREVYMYDKGSRGGIVKGK
jgi:ankyrin repeat protein